MNDVEIIEMTEIDSDTVLQEEEANEESAAQQSVKPDPTSQLSGDQKQMREIEEALDKMHISDPQNEPEGGEATQDQPEEELFTRDLVDVNRNSIDFTRDSNKLFPGSIEEIDLSIALKEIFQDEASSGPYLLRIVATCHNSEFNDLDEYVYSVRSNERYEYYDEVNFRIRRSDRAELKVAVKIPATRQPCTITGTLAIQLEHAVPVYLPITSKCEIPSVMCLKLLEDQHGTQMIKIPAKKGARLPPLPFKNLSSFCCSFEAETITSEDMSERAYDIACTSAVSSLGNSPFFVMLQLRNNPAYEGPMPTTDTIRKVLVLRVKNSSLYFSYPIEVYVYESSNTASNS